MPIFGRKRHAARQEAKADRQHHLGIKFGVYLHDEGNPRPPFAPSSDPVEAAFRLGVQTGWSVAEMDAEDDVTWFVREETRRGMLELSVFLSDQPWPSDPGPLDIHGGDAG